MFQPRGGVAPGRGQQPHVPTPEELIAMNPLAGYPDGYSAGGDAPLGHCGNCGLGCCEEAPSLERPSRSAALRRGTSTRVDGPSVWSAGDELADYLDSRFLELEGIQQSLRDDLHLDLLRAEAAAEIRRVQCRHRGRSEALEGSPVAHRSVGRDWGQHA